MDSYVQIKDLFPVTSNRIQYNQPTQIAEEKKVKSSHNSVHAKFKFEVLNYKQKKNLYSILN